jgi:hypothetical protein
VRRHSRPGRKALPSAALQPDLNPIEQDFAKLKTLLRSVEANWQLKTPNLNIPNVAAISCRARYFWFGIGRL